MGGAQPRFSFGWRWLASGFPWADCCTIELPPGMTCRPRLSGAALCFNGSGGSFCLDRSIPQAVRYRISRRAEQTSRRRTDTDPAAALMTCPERPFVGAHLSMRDAQRDRGRGRVDGGLLGPARCARDGQRNGYVAVGARPSTRTPMASCTFSPSCAILGRPAGATAPGVIEPFGQPRWRGPDAGRK